MVTQTLDRRSREVLVAVIAEYVRTAEPVGSRAVARRHIRGLSPATIRNVMADLEDMGYLSQPHPSAVWVRGRSRADAWRGIGRVVTRRYRGKTFRAIVDDATAPADPLDPLWTRSGSLLEQIVALLRDRTLYVSGATKLLDHPDLSDVATMRSLLMAFEEKAQL